MNEDIVSHKNRTVFRLTRKQCADRDANPRTLDGGIVAPVVLFKAEAAS